MHLLAINCLSQAEPVLPEMVIGRQSLYLYPDPWAFLLLLFLGSVLARWGWSTSTRPCGGLTASRSNLLPERMEAGPCLGQAYEIHAEERVWINPQGQYHSMGIKGSGYKLGASYRSGLSTRDWLAWKEEVSPCQSDKRIQEELSLYYLISSVHLCTCRFHIGIPEICGAIWRKELGAGSGDHHLFH